MVIGIDERAPLHTEIPTANAHRQFIPERCQQLYAAGETGEGELQKVGVTRRTRGQHERQY